MLVCEHQTFVFNHSIVCIIVIIYALVLVRKYSQVVQRYYVQYLVGFDAVQLMQSIQSVYGNHQDQQHYQQDPSYVILQSIIHTISALSVKQGNCNHELNNKNSGSIDGHKVFQIIVINRAQIYTQ